MILIKDEELIGLYLELKNNDHRLDGRVQGLLDRIERHLYQHLSIQEIENLDELYLKDLIKLE